MSALEEESDKDLLVLVAAEASNAFDVLYWRHGASVTRYAWALVSARETAQEVVQDTFTTLWTTAPRIHLAGTSLLPWLLVTCRNHAANARRTDARYGRIVRALKQNHERRDNHQDPHQLLWVLDAITDLAEPDRSVATLCLVDGLTYRQAGNALGLSEAAIGKRLERSRSILRRELDHEEPR